MKKINLLLMLSSLIAVSVSATDLTLPNEIEGYTIGENIETSGEIRTRFEYANEKENEKEKATALTNRLLINNKLKIYNNLDIFASVINVTDFGMEDYSYLTYGNEKYDYIGDKAETTMPELYLRYNSKKTNTVFSLGKQKLSFNNGRHIGIENWRQTYRTYNSMYLKNKTFDNIDLEFAYSLESEKIKKSFIALNGTYYFVSDNRQLINLTLYDFMVEDNGDSIGAILKGQMKNKNIILDYRAEISGQTESSLGETYTDETTMYWNLSTNIKIDNFNIGLLYSEQEENYNTPFATIHNFNGDLDHFATYGNINTFNINGEMKYGRNNIKLDYYSFSNNKTSDAIGNEIDVKYTYKYAKNLEFMLAGGMFNGSEDFINDTTKAWMQVDYKF